MLRDEAVTTEASWCGVERDAGYGTRCAAVHRTLRRIVKARGALDAKEIAALREASELRVWRHYGYASLAEYMEHEMGYSPRAAIERLRVARLLEDLPATADALAQGELSFSAVKELTRVATPETEAQWLEAAADKNVREVEDLVSGHQRGDRPTDPVDPKLKKRVLRYEVGGETVALAREAKRMLERERGEFLDDDAFLSAVFRAVLEGSRSAAVEGSRSAAVEGSRSAAVEGSRSAAVEGSPRADGERAPYQVAVTVCEDCKRGWQDGGGLTAEMSPPAVERALCDAEHIGSLDGDEVTRAKQDIPPAMRRKVKRRDHGRCRMPGCTSARNLDLHHIVPREQGGTHELENLITLCEGHHLAHHAGAIVIEGTASTAKFTRRAHNSFAIAERAADTAAALRGLGFARHEVAAAMDKTRAHVGTAELTIQQWITIALGYCPKPRA